MINLASLLHFQPICNDLLPKEARENAMLACMHSCGPFKTDLVHCSVRNKKLMGMKNIKGMLHHALHHKLFLLV